MRGHRQQILRLIEEQPRQARELADLTNTAIMTVYGVLWEFKALGIVCSKQLSATGRDGSRKVYALADTDLSAFA
jgi:DNA-binding IclR family transcriptional regulator